MRLALRGIALALLFAAAPAGAVTFTKIVGAPDTLYSYPAVDGGLVAFGAARFSTTEWGIYASFGGGSLAEVVGVGPSEPPGTVYPESSYGSFAFDGTTVAFVGRVDGGPSAIYTNGPGGLAVVVDSTTLLPNGNTLRSVQAPISIDSTGVAFRGTHYDDFPDGYHEGIYVASAGAAPRVVAERGMLAPEKGDPFWNLGVFDSHDGNTCSGAPPS